MDAIPSSSAKPGIILGGDADTPDMPITVSEVKHLRCLLAWMRCEYMLDPDAQRGYLKGAEIIVRFGIGSEDQANAIVQKAADKISQCPAYVRQAVKMLTKALRNHEQAASIFDSSAETVE